MNKDFGFIGARLLPYCSIALLRVLLYVLPYLTLYFTANKVNGLMNA